jgi:hypothetical protein
MLRVRCRNTSHISKLIGLNYFQMLWVLVNDSFNRKFSQNTFTDIFLEPENWRGGGGKHTHFPGEDWNKYGIIQVYRKIIF